MAGPGVVEITVNKGQLRTVLRLLAPSQRATALHAGMEEALAYLKRKVVEETPVDRGPLRAGIFTQITGTAIDNMHGRVLPSPATKEYAGVMEWGRKPGRFPPIDVITAWALRKGIDAPGFVIARAIARKGIKGHFMFTKTAERYGPQAVKIMHRSIRRWLLQ